MKNLINYYYGLSITEFRKIEDNFNFTIDNTKYSFILFESNINTLYEIYMLLLNNNIYCHEIVINKNNSLITYCDNKPYILLKKMICPMERVTLEDIIRYDIVVYNKYDFNWKDLWKEKIDYYEYQISQLGIKHKLLKESLSYYIGLSENAIGLLNYVDKSNLNSYVCHKRINYKEEMDSFFNPANIIIDNRVRDISEYFKINYINDNIDIDEVFEYLNSVNLNYDESLLFLSRLMYPSYYFDIYDKVIQGKISEDKVNFFIKKNVHYEQFLKSIYKYLKNKYRIPEIEWLEF